VRQAYDYVLSEGSPEYYREFISLYPHDPLCDRIRLLLGNLVIATAWHKAVLANSPVAYKSFYDSYSYSSYAKTALKLQAQPKAVPLMQFTHLAKSSPTFKLANPGVSGPSFGSNKSGGATGLIQHMPANAGAKPLGMMTPASGPKKIVTLPAKGTTVGSAASSPAKVTTFPGKINSRPIRVITKPVLTTRPAVTTAPRRFSGGNFSQRFATTQSRGSFGGRGSFRR
jgi:hypothetical protein